MSAATAEATSRETTAIGEGEILSTAQLRAEGERAEHVLAEFNALTRLIGRWVNTLPERYVAAPFGTDALTAAITKVTEAGGDGATIAEALPEITAALDEADSLGDKAGEIEADGNIDAFTPSG